MKYSAVVMAIFGPGILLLLWMAAGTKPFSRRRGGPEGR
jgi:hypothetical protein